MINMRAQVFSRDANTADLNQVAAVETSLDTSVDVGVDASDDNGVAGKANIDFGYINYVLVKNW